MENVMTAVAKHTAKRVIRIEDPDGSFIFFEEEDEPDIRRMHLCTRAKMIKK